jgi:hypothetical protein
MASQLEVISCNRMMSTIVSEIQRVRAKGSGQSLRERKMSIHALQSVDSSKAVERVFALYRWA